MSESKVFDFEAAINRVEGDEDLYRELFDLFLSDSDQTLETIRTAIESGNHTQVERTAHSIKSSLGNLGGMKAFDAALKLEMAGKACNPKTDESALFEVLQNEVDAFVQAAREKFQL